MRFSRRHRNRRRRQEGLSLLEVMIASAIMMAILLALYLVLHHSSRTTANQSTHLSLDQRARDLLAQMARELRSAEISTITVFDPNGYPVALTSGMTYYDAQFRLASAYDVKTKAIQYGNSVRYRWIPAAGETVNGKDDNLNALVDEGRVEKTDVFGPQPPIVTRPCEGVKAQGLRFVFNNRIVTITLELEQRDGWNNLVTRKAVTAVELRN